MQGVARRTGQVKTLFFSVQETEGPRWPKDTQTRSKDEQQVWCLRMTVGEGQKGSQCEQRSVKTQRPEMATGKRQPSSLTKSRLLQEAFLDCPSTWCALLNFFCLSPLASPKLNSTSVAQL